MFDISCSLKQKQYRFAVDFGTGRNLVQGLVIFLEKIMFLIAKGNILSNKQITLEDRPNLKKNNFPFPF